MPRYTHLLIALAAAIAGLLPSTPALVVDSTALTTSGGTVLFAGTPFSGTRAEYYTSGALHRITGYRDGKRHGIDRTWFEDGALASERTFSRGDKTGEHRGWWHDGTSRFECSFVDGQYDGVCMTWYADGALATVDRYTRGERDGLQQGWTMEQKLQYSFVVRDGRRYGVVGSKACFTTRPFEEA